MWFSSQFYAYTQSKWWLEFNYKETLALPQIWNCQALPRAPASFQSRTQTVLAQEPHTLSPLCQFFFFSYLGKVKKFHFTYPTFPCPPLEACHPIKKNLSPPPHQAICSTHIFNILAGFTCFSLLTYHILSTSGNIALDCFQETDWKQGSGR